MIRHDLSMNPGNQGGHDGEHGTGHRDTRQPSKDHGHPRQRGLG